MAYANPAAGRAREAGASSGAAIPVFTVAGSPVNGTSGTLAGIAPPGSLLVDITGKLLYQNTNTQASPTWTQREGAGGVATADLAAGIISADAAGRALFATGVFNEATVDAAFAAGAIDGDRLKAAGVTADRLANGAGLAALIAAGLGASDTYDHSTDAGENELLAADAGARLALVVAICLEAPAGDTPATFDVGEDGDEDKFLDQTVLANGTPGDIFIGAGTLTATEEVLVTVTAGSGGTPAGQYAVTVFVLPAAA